jgi:hypothetical protein
MAYWAWRWRHLLRNVEAEFLSDLTRTVRVGYVLALRWTEQGRQCAIETTHLLLLLLHF